MAILVKRTWMRCSKICLFIAVCFTWIRATGQKQKLSLSEYNDWPSLNWWPLIRSADNDLISYSYGAPVTGYTLVIQSLKHKWKIETNGGRNCSFSANSKYVFFNCPGDSIAMVATGRQPIINYTRNAGAFKISHANNATWIAYQEKGSANALVVKNISSNSEVRFDSTMRFFFSGNDSSLILEKAKGTGGVSGTMLTKIDLSNFSSKTIWEGEGKILQLTMTDNGEQGAFIAVGTAPQEPFSTLQYFSLSDGSCIELVNNRSIFSGMVIANTYAPVFSQQGDRLFFKVKFKTVGDGNLTPPTGMAGIDIWHYNDAKLQTQQSLEKSSDRFRTYTAVIGIKDRKLFRIETANIETIVNPFDLPLGDKILLRSLRGDNQEYNWKEEGKPSMILFSAKDGSRQIIKDSINSLSGRDFSLSPNGKYLVYYDTDMKQYFSYDTDTKSANIISAGVPVALSDTISDVLGMQRGLGMVAWADDNVSVLVYDHFDIWQLDITGRSVPVNITCGIGRKDNIILRISHERSPIPVRLGSNLILSAFNPSNKYTGFYLKKPGARPPELLTMGPYMYDYVSAADNINTKPPVCLGNSQRYIVERSSVAEAPNLFYTENFKEFTPLTHIQPQQGYNWMQKELVHWQIAGKDTGTAVLYKPDDFDPAKKYPVIFYFYEKLSNEFYNFQKPELSDGRLNIPYYVSNGYLVATPDISYKMGYPGASAATTVISLANFLSRNSWVDSTKLGLQGFSFGAFEVNYILTHTNLFAAAAECSGTTNSISNYNELRTGLGASSQYLYEHGQVRIGKTLWEALPNYIDNSPVLFADKVSTPLLSVHNKEDGVVCWEQGLEWFLALRRLRKKVWMLQYDGEGHSIGNPRNKLDYSTRLSQFFNHFLKGDAPPVWMTRGIPAVEKGKTNGYEMDSSPN